MHSSGEVPETNAPAFAAQIISLYKSALGDGAAVVAGIAALCVMLTTVLAAVDIGSRNIASTWQHVFDQSGERNFTRVYRMTIPVLVVLNIAVLLLLLSDFTAFLDLATSAAFIAAPVIAVLNHLAVTGRTMPDVARSSRVIRALNLAAILIMTALSVAFFALR